MIPGEAIAYFVILMLVGIAVPAAVWFYACRVKKLQFGTIALGAATFAVFAVFLESIPKSLLLQLPNPVSRYLTAHPWGLVIVAALLAGIFEETGRYLTYRTVLNKRTEKTTALAHGLGHGLFEVLFLFTVSGAQYLLYAALINSGVMETKLAEAALQAPEQVEQLRAVFAQMADITLALLPLALVERVGAVLFHMGGSILVFHAVRTPGRGWCLPLSIALHTLLDILAGLGQVGVITNVYVLEAVLLAFGAGMFILNYLWVYKKLPQDTAERAEEVTE